MRSRAGIVLFLGLLALSPQLSAQARATDKFVGELRPSVDGTAAAPQ